MVNTSPTLPSTVEIDTGVLQSLQIDKERLVRPHGQCVHRPVIVEQIVAVTEIAGEPRRECTTRLVVEQIR